jgi:hypothetical protein
MEIARHRRPYRVLQNSTRISLLLLLIAGAFLCGCRGRRVAFGQDEVLYRGTATEQEAKSLGDALKKEGFFKDRGFSVQLSKDPGGAIITYELKQGTWDDPDTIWQMELITRDVAPAVGGLPVKLRIANEYLSTKKELTVHPAVMIGAKDGIVYTDPATEQEAKALADTLKNLGFFHDNGTRVRLSKGQSGTVVWFTVTDGTWDKPDMVAAFELIGRSAAPSVGGLPIQVRLLNTSMESKKEISIR